MSVVDEALRIRDARDVIRDKMVDFGLSESTDKIDKIAADLAAVPNNGAVSERVAGGAYDIPFGFHDGNGQVLFVGGAGLNFSVVQYATLEELPEASPDNTIAVVSEVPMTGWTFAYSTPAEPTEGLVWILTGTTSTVEFNALKEDSLQVYPITAKQYINGAFVTIPVRIYQSSEWRDWITFITDGPEINEDLTGGFEAKAYGPSTSSGGTATAPSVTIGETGIYLRLNAGLKGAYFSKRTVDLTNYSVMKIDVSFLEYGEDGSHVRMAATTTKKANYVVAAAKSITQLGITKLDISSLTGAHYLLINLYTNYVKRITFVRWWLE